MRSGVNESPARIAVAVAVGLALLTVGLAQNAAADPGLKFQGERWIPALAVISSAGAGTPDGAPAPIDGSSLEITPQPAAPTEAASRDDARTIRAMLLIAPPAAIEGEAGERHAEIRLADDTGTQRDPEAAPATQAPESIPRGGRPGMLILPAQDVTASTGKTPEPADEIDRWVPAFTVYSGTLVEVADASISSSPAFDGPLSAPRDQFCDPNDDTIGSNVLRCPTGDDERMVTPSVGGGVELMTPGLESLPGSPRLFVHGGAEAAFSSTYDIAKEGVPDEIVLVPPDIDAGEQIFEDSLGQGSVSQVEVEPFVVTAGAGIAFTVKAFDRRFRIKPSFEYKREEITVEGKLNRVVQLLEFPPAFPAAGSIPRPVELSGSETKAFHGIGPGLELEMDAARAGPFVMTLFIGGKAYRFLGDRHIDFEAANDDVINVLGIEIPLDSETASWSYEKHRWGYEGGVGVRFRWLPE